MAGFFWGSMPALRWFDMGRDESGPSPVPAAQYIDAIAQHVSSVCVITTLHEGKRFGLTATAVSSVCAEPPRLLVCVNKSGMTHDRIVGAGRFAVNVLTEEQEQVAMVFAGMGGATSDRFASGSWRELATGAPILESSAAAFDCQLAEVHDHATHSVLFGDVVATAHQVGRDTLLYGGRKFRQLRKVFSMADGADEYL